MPCRSVKPVRKKNKIPMPSAASFTWRSESMDIASIDRPAQRQEENLPDHRHGVRIGHMHRKARRRRQRQHVADADQHRQRHQRHAVHAPPPAAENGGIRAGKCRHYSAPPCARAAKRSPRASKFANWSKLAAAGENSTTPLAVRALRMPRGTASSNVPTDLMRHAMRRSRSSANAGPSRPIRNAFSMRGK